MNRSPIARTLELARKVYKTVTGPPRHKRPELGTTVIQPGAGVFGPAWNSVIQAKWLGVRNPAVIPHYVRKMMRKDSQVSLGLAALKSPFFGIEYYFEGGRPIVRNFLRKTLTESPMWWGLVWSILNSLDFGHQTHEYVWGTSDVEVSEDDDDGSETTPTRPLVLRDRYVIRRMRDLDPERVVLLADEFGDLTGVRLGSGLFGGTENMTLSAERVMHAVNEGEFDNLLGNSVLDRAYLPWHDNNVALINFNRYLEQKGNPPLIGRAPPERRPVNPADPTQGEIECLEILNQALSSLRSGSVCVLPDERDDKGNLRWSIEALQVQERAEQFLSALRYNDAKILRGLWVPERTATQDSSVGSNAMASVHFDVFLLALEVKKERTLLAPVNEICRALVHYNFGKSETVPVCKATELARANNEVLQQAFLKVLSLPDDAEGGLGYAARELLDLPKMLQTLNVPRRRVRDVLREKAKRAAARPAPIVIASPEPDTKAQADRSESASALALARTALEITASPPAAAPPPAPINMHVNITNPPATVESTNNFTLPAQPTVIENSFTLPASENTVNVDVNAEIRGGSKTITITRDDKGAMTGADVVHNEPKPPE